MTGRQGFTLVELMVALVVTALVALLAHRTFLVSIDGVRQLRRARIEQDHAANAHRWLAAAFLSLDVGQVGSGPFEGHAERAQFTAWLPTSSGWMERAEVQIGMTGASFVATVGGTRVALVDSVSAVAFDYLLAPGADSRWANEWISPVSAPIAVRVRLEIGSRVDTVLYLIKARG